MTGLTETPQPRGRQKPLAEWIAELGGGPVSGGRAADELIAGRYRSWWFNHVTGEWNQIVQQYWLSPDPSDHLKPAHQPSARQSGPATPPPIFSLQ